MIKLFVGIFLFFLILCSGCVNYYESPQSGASSQSNMAEPTIQSNQVVHTTVQQQKESTCPPSTGNCNFVRGAANQITIQCNDGRQYIRGAAGQIIIQYPGKQIIVGATGQETIQGFDYEDAHCLIRWLENV
ncbi:MAG: hypothetical protein Q8N94_05085 [Methanoregula sp.]|nr:hypothetical protein [Methanoregula sp.]